MHIYLISVIGGSIITNGWVHLLGRVSGSGIVCAWQWNWPHSLQLLHIIELYVHLCTHTYTVAPSHLPLSISDLILVHWPYTSTTPHKSFSMGRPVATISKDIPLTEIWRRPVLSMKRPTLVSRVMSSRYWRRFFALLCSKYLPL